MAGSLRLGVAAAVSAAVMASSLSAQTPPPLTSETVREAAAPSGFATIDLPVDGATPASTLPEQWFWIWDQYGVRNVTRPTLTVVPPKAGTATGAAIIVAPGGGFNGLAWSNEGAPVAQWLADRGVAVFILKYRTKVTPRDSAGYASLVADAMASSRTSGRRFSQLPPEADQDARQAIRYVRANAAEWGVDPQRVGFLGFSAGAIAGLSAATATDPADRPSFVGLIYGPLAARDVPAGPPPLFAARALDDSLYGPPDAPTDEGFGLLRNWRASGGSVEFHLYSGGGHGFGMQDKNTTSDGWIEQFHAWMMASGLLNAGSPAGAPEMREAP